MDQARREARDAAAALLRHGPRTLREVGAAANVRTHRLIERAIANGDVEETGGYLVMAPRRHNEGAAPAAGATAIPAPSLEQPAEHRGAAMAMDAGETRVARIEATHPGALAEMVSRGMAFSGAGRAALTPYGRATLTLAPDETAVLYAIAAGRRGPRSIVDVHPDGNACAAPIARLTERGILRKDRRHHVIRSEDHRIEAGRDGVPDAASLLATLRG